MLSVTSIWMYSFFSKKKGAKITLNFAHYFNWIKTKALLLNEFICILLLFIMHNCKWTFDKINKRKFLILKNKENSFASRSTIKDWAVWHLEFQTNLHKFSIIKCNFRKKNIFSHNKSIFVVNKIYLSLIKYICSQ